MLQIATQHVEAVRMAKTAKDLHHLVQLAIELEHSTIPPYLCGYYTLKPGTNEAVAEVLRSVVIEEMLHMSIACNLMIALGGSPGIDSSRFVPKYPGELPMSIGGGLVVPLKKCSVDQVRDVFMKIEEPKDPLVLRGVAESAVQYETIGEFYAALDAKLKELGQSVFQGAFDQEMVDHSWFPKDQLFRIECPESASAAIQVIVEQGEGTTVSPLDPENDVAHYYRFEQIVRGHALVPDASAPHGFSFSGAKIEIDESAVWNMQPNPDPDQLPAGSRARLLSNEFDRSYTRLLRTLHKTFNGNPTAIEQAMGQMFELRLLSQEVLAAPVPGSPGLSTGLAFRYDPTA